MLSKIKPRSEFSRNVLTLMTGTTIAQAIPLAISPILTRIYTPEEFGMFALFMSIAAIIAVVATGRYELAIMLPKKKTDALNVLFLSLILTLMVSLALFLIVVFFTQPIALWFDVVTAGHWLYFIPASVLIIGAYQSLNFWNNRMGNYKSMSVSRVVQSGGVGATQLVFGSVGLSALGLVLGQIFGFFISICLLIKIFPHSCKPAELRRVSKLKMIAMARRYSRFPKFLILAHGLNVSSSQSPVILLNALFLSSTAGFFMLTQRVISAPTSILASAIGDVFRQKASNEFAVNGQCYDIFVKTLKTLVAIAIVPFIAFYFIAPLLFSVVFGPDWAIAGEYAQILTPMYFFKFISSPLSNMYMIAEKQKHDLVFQVALFTCAICSFYFAWFQALPVEMALAFFSFSYSVAYVWNIVITLKFSKGHLK